ncbi:MAG: hypothetical protein WCE90_11610 [Candidatus Zixiibacteriota bacterium]
MEGESQLTWPAREEEIRQAFLEMCSGGDWRKYAGERVRRLAEKFPWSHDCRFGISICDRGVAIDMHSGPWASAPKMK